MSSTPDVLLDLQTLENEMRRLEVEYTMFFAGTHPKPPWDMRARVEAMIRRYDRTPMTNTADRFRFSTLQQRFAAFADLWERGMKAREEGRPLPFASGGGAPPPSRATEPMRAPGSGRGAAFKTAAKEQVLHVTRRSRIR